MQADPAVARMLLTHLEILTAWRELNAGRRRGQQPQVAAPLIPFLMHVPPQQRAHLGMTIEHGEQRIGVAQADGGDPCAADVDRLMVQAHQAMALPCRA